MGSTKTKEITQDMPVVEKNDSGVSKKKISAGRGQAYKAARTKIDKTKLYTLEDAIRLVKETNIAKFNASMEFHATVKKEGLTVNVNLPHSMGSTKIIELADEKTIKKLEAGKVDFDVLLATPDMMPKLVPFARILGPRGMMPNPKNGTLIKKAEDAKKFSLDTLNLKTERKAPLMHTVFGKIKMSDEELLENLKALIDAVNKRQIVKATISSSMSPSVKLLVE